MYLMRRRAFLRATSAAGLAMGFPLAGCASDQTTPSATRVPPLDPNLPWWQQHNYASVLQELDVADLEVRGAIPPELDGVYLRNGSNPREGDNTHWFLGDGMIHGVRLEQGRASWYKNRYVRTPFYEDGSTGVPGGANSHANVSLVHHAGRVLAAGEVGFPYEIDPTDLSTVGPYDFNGGLETAFTAHPAIDPNTGYLHFFGYGFLGGEFLTYCVADADGALVSCEVVDIPASTMMHSFAITDRDVIFWDLPVLFDLSVFSERGFPFRWDASHPARIGVMPLGGPASEIRWVQIDPCYVFHTLNAFREGDDIVLDVCRYDEMMNGERFGSLDPELRRWRIDTSGEALSFSDSVVTDRTVEFPFHDRRFTGRPTRYGWFVATRDNPDTVDPGGLVRYDSQTGAFDEWDPGPLRQSGEPFFVSGAGGEGEGWLVTYVYDFSEDASDLVILDATDVAAGPVAEVRMPRRVPHGFHGVWVPA
jgi:carotenoid cleavage dioxygenase